MSCKSAVLYILRIILATVFIFSGFVKGVDPWGTAIKLGDYFQAFGLDFLSSWNMGFAILLSGFEMFLGLVVMFNLRPRIITPIAAIVMICFTLVTLILALTNPISDCGCFGDAVKLTNWQTFYKNLVLLAIALTIWIWERNGLKGKISESKSIIEWSLGLLFMLSALGIGIYSYRHLPLIDFLPFKVGVHIPTNMEGVAGNITTTLIYRDKTNGNEREFALEDTTWQDTLRWEFIDTKVVEHSSGVKPTITDFSIFNKDGEYTQDLLSESDNVFIVTMTDISKLSTLSERCLKAIDGVASYVTKHDQNIILVTTSTLPADGKVKVGDFEIPSYNIDGTTLKTLIRAKVGMVVIKNGTIIAKWNCRDIPNMERFLK